ncbi:MAG: 30S ribosome-binding factor RbfA [Bacteroidota bacterium]
MESQRQRKIAGIIQRDIADVLRVAIKDGGLSGTLISVTKVSVTVDLSIAKVYLSIFPPKDTEELMKGITSNGPLIKHELAQRTRHQLRRMPELSFFVDDSLDYIQNIEESLKGEENPLENRGLLERRKKL